MNEIMEILYQWHHGSSIKGIARSLGYDRKTIRRYVRCGHELQGKLKEVVERSAIAREAPAKEMLGRYRDEIGKLLAEK